jgi:hypothetical protein
VLSFDPSEKELDANEEFTICAYFIPQQNLDIGYHNPGSGGSEQPSVLQGKKVFSL